MKESASEKMTLGDKSSATVVRGAESWTFIYVFLGFALTIGGNFIQIIEPLGPRYNPAVFFAFVFATVWLFIGNGRFQNWLIGMKIKYETKAR
jgi:hypothetical protein